MADKKTGIDVSRHQEDIDWKKVSKDNDDIDFVFIKATQGTAYSKVNYFYENVPKARAVGLNVGAYHYGTMSNIPEALTQAKYMDSVIDKVKDQLTYPVVLDLEENKNKVSKKQLTDAALAFMDYFKNKGYQVLLYTGDYFLDSNLDEERLKDAGYLFWVARYGNKPKNDAHIHQYSDSGQVDGIDGAVDMNVTTLDFSFTVDKQYKVTIDNLQFWQARALVSEYEKKGYECYGNSIKVLGPDEQPKEDTPYKFTIKGTYSQAVSLVIELKIRGYARAVGNLIK